jgi:2-oxoglutarate ferredoxin oxidoreductase subunit delta
MPVKGWIEVNELYCKGCDLCVNNCPQHVLALDLDRLTPKGYHPVKLISTGCTGCVICAIVCPEAALTVYREVPLKASRPASGPAAVLEGEHAT